MKKSACGTFTSLAAAAVAVLSVAAAGAQEPPEPVLSERADGAVELRVDGRQFAVAAEVAESVAEAVLRHARDPEQLQQSIEAIVTEHAGEPGDAEQAVAIVALALYYARNRAAYRSVSVAAIVRGALTGNPQMAGGDAVALLTALQSPPSAEQVEEQRLARLQATVENPGQVSPVQ